MRFPRTLATALAAAGLALCVSGRATAGYLPEDVRTMFPASAEHGLRVGDKVDIKQQTTIDGKPFRFDWYTGKKHVLVVFWLNTCDLCLQELVDLREYIRANKLENKLAVVTVNKLSEPEDVKEAREAFRVRKLPYPILKDPKLYLAGRFMVNMVPSMILIDRKGNVATPQAGRLSLPVRTIPFKDAIKMSVAGKKLPDDAFTPYSYEETMRRKWIGKKAPLFELNDLVDTPAKLSDMLGAGPTLLFFWHPECPFCKEQIVRMNNYYKAKKDTGSPLRMVGVAGLGKPEQRMTAATMKQDEHLDFPLLNDKNLAVTKEYGVERIPLVFVLDRDGVVRSVFYGDFVDTPQRLDPVVAPLSADR